MRGRVSWRLATPSCVATLSTPRHHTPTRRAPHGSSNSNLNPNLPLTLTLTLTLILTLILTRRAAWLFCACSDALPRWLDSQASTACTLHTHTAHAHCTHTPSALAPPAPTAQVLPFTLRPPPVLQASTPTKAALGLGLLLCLLLLLHPNPNQGGAKAALGLGLLLCLLLLLH